MGGKRLGTDPDVEKLARKARKGGLEVSIARGSRHIVWTHHDCKCPPQSNGEPAPFHLTTPLTYGDPRRIKRIHKFLRSHGVTP